MKETTMEEKMKSLFELKNEVRILFEGSHTDEGNEKLNKLLSMIDNIESSSQDAD